MNQPRDLAVVGQQSAATATTAAPEWVTKRREVDQSQGAAEVPTLLEAQLDVLLDRKAGAAELTTAAQRLQPVARTSGAVCSLALAALRTGNRASAREFAERALQLDPRGIGCRDDRLAWTADGQIAYRLKRPWPDGRTELVLPPMAFLRRLCGIIPPPRRHLVCYAGVFGPASKARA